ncbi:MAG TPA: MATE family efflux transporter, partial [Vicinamibacterales bacterium]|nr:MATE family efflux transporter [Vicinamibacterales bacterium]
MNGHELTEARSSPLARAWALVREALGRSTRDFTEGDIGHSIVVLAIPMVMEMSMESLFAVVDVFFVARLGADAVATVGLTESMLAIVYSVAVALCIGATATVSRRIGEKDPEGAAQAAAQVILLGIIVSAVFGVVGAMNARRLLALMGASPSILGYNARFTMVMLGGNACIMLLFLQNAIFRGTGDATVAMRVLWLANGINLVLDPCFIFGLGPFPELGVVGASVATTTGRSTAVLIQLWVLLSGGGRIHIQRRHLRIIPSVMWNMCRLSGTGLLQILLQTTSWIGLV